VTDAHDLPLRDRCLHPRTEVRRRDDAVGRPRYVHQCVDCGASVGCLVAKTTALAGGEPPPFDAALDERAIEDAKRFYEEQRAARSQAWWDWYNAYLRTDAWWAKRAQVLKRDNWICQGCYERQATQVHHLSYAHVGDELLFELASICDECHDRAHVRSNSDV
jgi:5-methylcytosine-specific restriction endonuclease McrA